MAIRTPFRNKEEVTAIHHSSDRSDRNVTQVYRTENGATRLVWEANNSSFLDKFGNVFFDKFGIPFQGRREQ